MAACLKIYYYIQLSLPLPLSMQFSNTFVCLSVCFWFCHLSIEFYCYHYYLFLLFLISSFLTTIKLFFSLFYFFFSFFFINSRYFLWLQSSAKRKVKCMLLIEQYSVKCTTMAEDATPVYMYITCVCLSVCLVCLSDYFFISSSFFPFENTVKVWSIASLIYSILSVHPQTMEWLRCALKSFSQPTEYTIYY